MSEVDSTCAVAHGASAPEGAIRTLVAVFDSPVAGHLLHFGADTGFRVVLVEPDEARAKAAGFDGPIEPGIPAWLDDNADVIVTDHHRGELGPMLRDALARPTRWIGVLGNPRHPGPHIKALSELGVPASEIERVHRPVGLNIGSRTPPEIAIATLAGLIADRNERPGGFDFAPRR
jgi:xanthine/CO dehydrogenase XdhC/CoxF family maturation factor